MDATDHSPFHLPTCVTLVGIPSRCTTDVHMEYVESDWHKYSINMTCNHLITMGCWS